MIRARVCARAMQVRSGRAQINEDDAACFDDSHVGDLCDLFRLELRDRHGRLDFRARMRPRSRDASPGRAVLANGTSRWFRSVMAVAFQSRNKTKASSSLLGRFLSPLWVL